MKVSRLKLIRIELGLKVKDVAEKLGISPSYLSLIENRHKPLTIDLQIKLANVYCVKPMDLVD